MRIGVWLCVVVAAVSFSFAGPKPKVSDQVLAAKNVLVIARVGVTGNGKTKPDAKRAQAQIVDGLRKWERFTVVDDAQKADLVLIVTEANTAAEGESDRTRF